MVEYAAERGAHVVCEKPLGRNAYEGRASAFTAAHAAGYLAVYGTTGTLHLEGQPWFNRLQHFTSDDGQWADLAIPALDDPVQAGWSQPIADVVADINGTGAESYPHSMTDTPRTG